MVPYSDSAFKCSRPIHGAVLPDKSGNYSTVNHQSATSAFSVHSAVPKWLPDFGPLTDCNPYKDML